MLEKFNTYLLLFDVPNNTEVGIDMKFWTVGSKFKGLKHIPSGPHIIYWRAANSSGPRSSFLINYESTDKPKFIKFIWDQNIEDLVTCVLNDSDLDSLTSNLEEIKLYLGNYPHDEYENWISLANFLDFSIFSSFFPKDGILYSCDMLQSKASTSKQRLSSQEGYSIDHMKQIPGTEVRLTPIPKLPFISNPLDSSSISNSGIDKSETLEFILDKISNLHHTDRNILEYYKLSQSEYAFLAELQFAFITFLIVERIESWLHWRKMVALITSCKNAISSHVSFYSHSINIIYHQLKRDSNSHFDKTTDTIFSLMAEASSSDERNSEPYFIPFMLKQLCYNIKEAATQDKSLNQLCYKVDGLRVSMEKHYGWEIIVPSSVICQADSNGDLSEIPVSEIDWDSEDAPTIAF